MPLSKDAREWAGLGQKLHSATTPGKAVTPREYIVFTRKSGKSLIVTIPAPLRKALSLYESAPMKIVREGKALRLTRLETITTAQIEILKAQHPRAKVPWAKKLHLLGNNHPAEQYELQGLPTNLSALRLPGGQEPENSS